MTQGSREVTEAEALKLFKYEDGDLLWRVSLYPSELVGSVAGHPMECGYKSVTIARHRGYIHRIVWIMHHGTIPQEMTIEHVDGDRRNNRIENLRSLR